MAKKAKKKADKFADYMEHTSLILDVIKKGFSMFAKNIQKIVYHTEEKIMQILLSSSLFIISIVFVSIAFILLLPELTGIHIGWAFLAIGIVLMLWAYAIKKNVEKTKYEVH